MSRLLRERVTAGPSVPTRVLPGAVCTPCPELQVHEPGPARRSHLDTHTRPSERGFGWPLPNPPQAQPFCPRLRQLHLPTRGTQNCDVIPTPLLHPVSSPSDSSSAGSLLVPLDQGTVTPHSCLRSPPVSQLSTCVCGPRGGRRPRVPQRASQTRCPSRAALCPSLMPPHTATAGTALPTCTPGLLPGRHGFA